MPSLSNRRIRRLLTNEDFGLTTPQSIPFTFVYTEKEPAQILSFNWTVTTDAFVFPRVPFVNVNDPSGTRYAQIWGRQVLTALQTEVCFDAIGNVQNPFFGSFIMGGIPPDLWLEENMELFFFCFFGNGPTDIQSIRFQLAQYN